jgi:hypothetical protein
VYLIAGVSKENGHFHDKIYLLLVTLMLMLLLILVGWF